MNYRLSGSRTASLHKMGISRRLPHLEVQGRPRQKMDGLPILFYRGVGRPVQTPTSLPPGGSHRCRRTQFGGNSGCFRQPGSSDGGGSINLYQLDDKKINPDGESFTLWQPPIHQGFGQRRTEGGGEGYTRRFQKPQIRVIHARKCKSLRKIWQHSQGKGPAWSQMEILRTTSPPYLV